MYMKKLILKMALLMVVPFMVSAQETKQEQPQQLSLKDVVDYAVKYSKQLQSSRMNTELYNKKIREAASACWPQIWAELGYSTDFGQSLNMAGMEIKMDDASSLTATAAWTLNAQSIIGIKVSKLAAKLAEQQIATTELDVKENVVNTYYAVLVYQRNIDILKLNLENMQEILEHTQHQFDAGA